MNTLWNFVLCLIVAWASLPLASAEILKVQGSAVPAAHGMYVKNSQEIWLADTFKKLGGPSKVYNTSGEAIAFAPKGVGLSGIAKHPSKELFSFCDVMGSKIHWVREGGQSVQTLSLANPWNARWAPSGKNMFVVNYSGSVFQISEKNQITEILNGLDAPFDIAPISDEAFWVSEQGAKGSGQVCLYQKNRKASVFQKVVCNQNWELDNPEGLWPLTDSSVLAVDTGKGTLVKIENNGQTKMLSDGLGLPIHVQLLNDRDWVVFTNQSSVGPAVIFGASDL